MLLIYGPGISEAQMYNENVNLQINLLLKTELFHLNEKEISYLRNPYHKKTRPGYRAGSSNQLYGLLKVVTETELHVIRRCNVLRSSKGTFQRSSIGSI